MFISNTSINETKYSSVDQKKFYFVPNNNTIYLTHFRLIFPLYTSWEHRVFSGGMKWDHWPEMGEVAYYISWSITLYCFILGLKTKDIPTTWRKPDLWFQICALLHFCLNVLQKLKVKCSRILRFLRSIYHWTSKSITVPVR